MKNTFFILIVLVFSSVFSQTQVENFFVDGVCGMCKDRIERSCIKVKGIRLADWNLENREIKVIYNAKKISIDEIHKFIASIGHDTKKEKAPDEAYNSLDMCCKYRDEEVVKDHQKKKHRL